MYKDKLTSHALFKFYLQFTIIFTDEEKNNMFYKHPICDRFTNKHSHLNVA